MEEAGLRSGWTIRKSLAILPAIQKEIWCLAD